MISLNQHGNPFPFIMDWFRGVHFTKFWPMASEKMFVGTSAKLERDVCEINFLLSYAGFACEDIMLRAIAAILAPQ